MLTMSDDADGIFRCVESVNPEICIEVTGRGWPVGFHDRRRHSHRHAAAREVCKFGHDQPCDCGETSTRNCPVHRNGDSKLRQFWVRVKYLDQWLLDGFRTFKLR